MKYKNYRNAYTNDNRIYSYTDISEMPLREIFTRKQELLSQYRVLGIPTEQELKGSENVVHVESYTREDGTEVKAHYRSKPNSGSGTSGNNDIKAEEENIVKSEPQKEENSENQKQETTEQEQTETTVDKRLYPDEIAGVKRGEPMSFEEADGGNVNPNYNNATNEKDGQKYFSNCQGCVVAYELRRRGYDVEAAPYLESEKTGELSNTLFEAWVDSDTNEVCEVGTEINVMGGEDCYETLETNVEKGERYALVDAHFVKTDEGERVDSHVRIVERDDKGNLIMYDPQDGGIRKGEDMKAYITKWMGLDAELKPQYLRIDNKIPNQYYVNDVVIPRQKRRK